MAALTGRGSGAVIPAHRHTNTDEMSFVLHGDLVEDGESFGPGSKSLEFGWMPPNPATNGKRSGRFTATAHGM